MKTIGSAIRRMRWAFCIVADIRYEDESWLIT